MTPTNEFTHQLKIYPNKELIFLGIVFLIISVILLVTMKTVEINEMEKRWFNLVQKDPFNIHSFFLHFGVLSVCCLFWGIIDKKTKKVGP